MKGKCISACNRGQRNKSDFYQTPYSMTEQLLENEIFIIQIGFRTSLRKNGYC